MITTNIKTANPFPGLRPFTEKEAHLFFGRTRQIKALCEKLESTRFLAVVGASGSGKSSLIHCGLIQNLPQHLELDEANDLFVAQFRPGSTPVESLAQAFNQLSCIKTPYKEILHQFKQTSSGIVNVMKTATLTPRQCLLIYIDQFEELFRYHHKSKNAVHPTIAHFVNLILTAKAQRNLPIYILFSMRSDFLGDCALYEGLPEAINEGQYLVPRMNKTDQREAIIQPILQSGATITPALVDLLLEEIGNNTEQLPVLQHALMRTWNYWIERGDYDKPIDIRHYEAIGGVEYALSQHADEAFAELKTDSQRRICETIFKAITDKGTDSRGVRRPTSMGQLCKLTNASLEDVGAVVNVFRKPSRAFLMPTADKPLKENTIIDIAHESLMRVWTKLIHWVDEEVLSAETYIQLAKAAALYQENQAGLWRDPELQMALTWEEKNQPNVVWANRYDSSYERAIAFLHYSRDQRDFELVQKEAQHQRKLRRSRILASVFGFLTIISIIATLYALIEQGIAQESKQKALESAKLAKEKSKEARKNERLAMSASLKATENEKIAQRNAVNAQQSAAEAEKNAALALLQENLAKEQTLLVEQQKLELEKSKAKLEKAIKAIEDAKGQEERLKVLAEIKAAEASKNALTANQNAIKALREKQTADSLRSLNTATAQAIHAKRLIREGNTMVGASEALQAYTKYDIYNGTSYNPDIFSALEDGLSTLKKNRNNTFKGHNVGIRALAIHPKNKIIATGDEKGVIKIWDTSTGKTKTLFAKERIRTMTYNPNGHKLFVGTVDGSLMVFNFNTKKKRVKPKTLEKNEGLIHSLFLIQKGGKDYIFYASPSGIIIGTLQENRFRLIGRLERDNTQKIAVSGDGNLVALATTKAVYFYKLNYTAKQIDKILGKPTVIRKSKVTALALDKNGSRLAIGSQTGFVAILNTKAPHFEKTYLLREEKAHRSRITQLTFNASSTQLASASTDKIVKLWDVNHYLAEQEIDLPPHFSWVWNIAYDKSGHYLYSVSEDKQLKKWHTSSKGLAEELEKVLFK